LIDLVCRRARVRICRGANQRGILTRAKLAGLRLQSRNSSTIAATIGLRRIQRLIRPRFATLRGIPARFLHDQRSVRIYLAPSPPRRIQDEHRAMKYPERRNRKRAVTSPRVLWPRQKCGCVGHAFFQAWLHPCASPNTNIRPTPIVGIRVITLSRIRINLPPCGRA